MKSLVLVLTLFSSLFLVQSIVMISKFVNESMHLNAP